METRFVVEPVWSWVLVALVASALPTLVLLTYPQRIRHLPRLTRRFLLGARLAAAMLLAIAMLRPEIRFTELDRKTATLAILADKSRSMSTPDGPGGISRRDHLIRTIEACADSGRLDELGELIDVRVFEFGTELTASESLGPDSVDSQTAIGYSLESLLREVQGLRMIGVIPMSDGAQRAIAPRQVDPRMISQRFADLSIPIFPVPFGEDDISEAGIDIAVEDLTVSDLVHVKNVVPVRTNVRVVGAAGREFAVQLLVEDRSGKANTQDGEMKVPTPAAGARTSIRIKSNQNSETIPVELSYIPQIPGEFRIGVRVVPLDGELKKTNNERQTLITVQKGGVSVAYFDTARDEQLFIREVNESRQIQLDYYWIRTGLFADRTRIEPELFDAGRYDVYIIGDVPASSFGPEALRRLAQRADEGAGLIMTGGLYSFGPGGYASTPLDAVVPVLMNARDTQAAGDIAEELHIEDDLKMLPTEAGLRHFVMRLSATDNRAKWQALPPLRGACRLRRRNTFVEVLAQSGSGVPLLFSMERGNSRVLAFAGDTTWRWWMNESPSFRDEHQRFWRQVILWLARKELESEHPIRVIVDPRNFDPGEDVPVEIGIRDEAGRPVPDARIKTQIIRPDGKEYELATARAGDGWQGDFSDTKDPGIYRVVVSASVGGEPIPGQATTRFLVDSRDLELDNPAADPALLKDLARNTGGRVIPPEELKDFLAELIEEGPASLEEKHVTRVPLWDNWWFLGCFVLLMSIEWFVRKRRGLV